MDPSLSISTDPHHPPQFTPFPFPTSNSFVSGAVAPPNPPFYGVPPNPYNNHVFRPQTQPQSQPPSQASYLRSPQISPHPLYTEMICAAIAALNEPDGSSKMAISRYMERTYPGLPPNPSHGALLTHHLKSLKSNGVLAMVKKSYKFAVSSPPESVAVAAAAAAAGLEPPRSEIPPVVNDQAPIDPVAVTGSASQPQKRGRGRPPKPKPESQPQQQQTGDVQPNQVQSNGPVSQPISQPTGEVTESAKRGPGRPRKNGAGPVVQASVMAGIMKRRGRPPGRRAAGRQRKPKSVSSTVSVFPYVANGARRRGRPRRVVETSGAIVPAAPAGGETVAVAPGMKRGRGRPPKIGGVINRLITKPNRGRGRPVGRPRKYPRGPVTGAQDSAAYGELKTKFDLFQEKAKEILNVLKAGVTSDDEAVVRAIQDLEGLTVIETAEPQAMEEMKPEEAAPPPPPPTEAEAQGEAQGEEQEQEREGGGEQVAHQTEAEAMQEALF